MATSAQTRVVERIASFLKDFAKAVAKPLTDFFAGFSTDWAQHALPTPYLVSSAVLSVAVGIAVGSLFVVATLSVMTSVMAFVAYLWRLTEPIMAPPTAGVLMGVFAGLFIVLLSESEEPGGVTRAQEIALEIECAVVSLSKLSTLEKTVREKVEADIDELRLQLIDTVISNRSSNASLMDKISIDLREAEEEEDRLLREGDGERAGRDRKLLRARKERLLGATRDVILRAEEEERLLSFGLGGVDDSLLESVAWIASIRRVDGGAETAVSFGSGRVRERIKDESPLEDMERLRERLLSAFGTRQADAESMHTTC